MKITIVNEADALPQVASVAELLSPRGDVSARAVVTAQRAHATDDLMAHLRGRIAGIGAPPWADGSQGAVVGETVICRVAGCYHLPKFGAVVSRRGEIFRASVGEAKSRWPDLSGLPGFSSNSGEVHFDPPTRVPRRERINVFLPWGANFNFGHFVLDALPSLLALEEAGALDGRPATAPPLRAWQRQLIRRLLPRVDLIEEHADVVMADDLVFPTSLDHFLGAPNEILLRVRDRVMTSLPRDHSTGGRVYFSRRRQVMRVMVNEVQIERELRARGFRIIHPETLSVDEQIAIVRAADMIVAPTGAALGNALFARPGTTVIEIVPANYASPWVRAMSMMLGLDWHGYFCASPGPASEVPPIRRLRKYQFGYRVPSEPFLRFLDFRLAARAGR